MTKYIFCILACAFLVLGFSNVSNKELQGFQKKTETSSNDCIFDNLSFPRSIVPFKNLKFNTNTVIIQILSSLNVMLPENRLGHTGLDVNYTKYSCKYYVYTLAHILI